MFYSEALSLRAQLQVGAEGQGGVSPGGGVFPVTCDSALVFQARPNPDSDGSAELLRRLRLCKALQQRLSNKPLDFYTCTFRGAKLDK